MIRLSPTSKIELSVSERRGKHMVLWQLIDESSNCGVRLAQGCVKSSREATVTCQLLADGSQFANVLRRCLEVGERALLGLETPMMRTLEPKVGTA